MVDHWLFCLQLLAAAALGGLIGLEREFAGKPAGLRTNSLICMGSALLTHVSISFPSGESGDPSRIAAMIVSGIGFLGAGAIIQAREGVHGLTSAATIWVVAGVGMAVGAGILHDALLATGLILLSLIALGRIERRVLGQHVISLTARLEDRLIDPRALLSQTGRRRRLLRAVWESQGSSAWLCRIEWKGFPADVEALATALRAIPGAAIESWKIEE